MTINTARNHQSTPHTQANKNIRANWSSVYTRNFVGDSVNMSPLLNVVVTCHHHFLKVQSKDFYAWESENSRHQ